MLLPLGTGLGTAPLPELAPPARLEVGMESWKLVDEKFGNRLPLLMGPGDGAPLVPELNIVDADVQRVIDGFPLSDAPRLQVFTIPFGVTQNFGPGDVHITEDWSVLGTANFVDANIIFDGLFTITVGNTGKLSITGASSVRDADTDSTTLGFIRSTGELTIQGSAAVPIPIKSVAVIPLARASNDFPATRIEYAQFSDSRAALQFSNSEAFIEHNTFTNNDRALTFLGNGGLTNAGNGTAANNTFVGNFVGLQFASGTTTRGLARNNEFYVNGMGILCSSGATGANRPVVSANNFRNHYAEAYSGVRGASVPTPVGTVTVLADSTCLVDGNHFATGETTFQGGADTIQNNAASPIPNSAPASPLTPQIVTTTQTLNSPTLTGPLITDNSGTLTINGVLNANGFLWGSGTGGRLVTTSLQVQDNGMLIIRNDNDSPNGIKFLNKGKKLTFFTFVGLPPIIQLHALQHRSDATLDGWEANGFDFFVQRISAPVVDPEGSPTPTARNFVARNGMMGFFDINTAGTVTASTFSDLSLYGYIGTLGTVTFNSNTADRVVQRGGSGNLAASATCNGNTFRDGGIACVAVTGTLTCNTNTVQRSVIGCAAALGTATTDGNKFTAVENALQAVQGGLTSRNDELDGGQIGILTSVAAVTVTNALIVQQDMGIATVLDTSYAVTASSFQYNAHGIATVATNVVVNNANFRDNYQYSFYIAPAGVEPNVMLGTSVTCSGCHFYRADDRSWSLGSPGNPVGTVTVTESPAPNAAPNPSWLNNVVIAGPGEVKEVSGALAAPAIARQGGRLVLDGVTVDGADRFAIGAKTGGNAQGATGHVTVTNSVLENVRFLSVNSTQSVVEGNIFRSTAIAIELSHNQPVIECNRFQSVGLAAQVLRNMAPLEFRRNLVTGNDGVLTGLGDVDSQDVTAEDNGLVASTAAYVNAQNGGLVQRAAPGDIILRGNNFVGTVGASDTDDDFVSNTEPMQVILAENNYWNHANGPGLINDPVGTAAPVVVRLAGASFVYNLDGFVDWDPWRAVPNAIVPCVNFSFLPLSPAEEPAATFTDKSFDPGGLGIIERKWEWGDGSPDTITPDATTTHNFLDGGTFSVKLTVTTAAGGQASLTKQVVVRHVPPVADFVSGIVNELTPVSFTDASTHPNPGDAPPGGWTYGWNFNAGEGTSALRNPSFRFADGGNKVVRLDVTDNDGQTDSESKTIAVPHVPPVANFNALASDELTPVSFTDTSTHPNPADAPAAGWTYLWNFNGEGTSALRNPSFRFPDGGSKTVTLTVTDNDGQSNSINKVVVVAHAAPNPGISHQVQSPGRVNFNDASTHPNPADAPPAGWLYEWDFENDGVVDSTARNPGVHDYGVQSGIFDVRLTVTDNDGITASLVLPIDVAKPNLPPLANFTVNPPRGVTNNTIRFTDTSSDPDGSVVGWLWTFGDGASSTARNPTHKYAAPGDYTVTLVVTDDGGLQASKSISYHVCQPPGPGISIGGGIHISLELCLGV